MPERPRAWIIQTARHKAVDRLRRRASYTAKVGGRFCGAWVRSRRSARDGDREITDDRLRLTFTCCSPALSLDAQVALALRKLCSLETDAIARAFLVPEPAMAQRLVRANRRSATRAFRTACPTNPSCPTGSTLS